ncbi:MAG: NB-ARC domain-containing protein, partial [Chloroflexota bacterium]|nr:NB-ARC domain-containing protein [Chloroflexota bacterium]
MLTLTGPGGSGKTRLALEAMANVPGDFPDGVWLVDLSVLTDPALIAQAVATTLDISAAPDQPLPESIVRVLANRRLLLLLDNCEHLVDACAALAALILRRTTGVRLLLTSREPLRLPGEVTWPVPSLTLPDRQDSTATGVLVSESARLFLERARSVQPDIALADADATALVQICHRLDGIPLAIELAAARVRVLSLPQIASRLDDRFRLLGAGSRTAPTRQQTLKGAIDWSYDLLDEAERQLFRRLAVFAGGFELESAEDVCIGEEPDASDVLDILARLIDKSLLLVERSGPEHRYRMLESIREYAAARLAEQGETMAVSNRHAGVFLRLAEEAEPHLRRHRQRAWLDRLDREHDNIRATIECFRQRDDVERELRLAGALAWFWHRGGHLLEGRLRLTSALGRSTGIQSPARLKALLGAGITFVMLGELADGVRWLQEAATLAGTLADRQGLAIAHVWLVWPTLFRNGPAAALPLAETALATFRAGTDRWHLAIALMGAGFVTGELGELATARARFGEASAIFRDLGDHWGIATSLTELARIAYRERDSAAQMLATEALAASRAMGDRWQTVQALGLLVEVARVNRDYDQVATLGGEAVALASDIGQHASAGWAHRDLGHAAIARGDTGGAIAHFAAGYGIFKEREYKLGLACVLVGLATLSIRDGDGMGATRRLGGSRQLLEETSTALAPADRDVADEVMAVAREILGDAAFATAFAEGRSLSIE